jgi:uncharacterized protein
MSDKLPELIDPLMLADRRSVLSGAIKVAALERLSDVVAENDGDVEVDIVFAKQGKRAVVNGSITATLQLKCQSCLRAMPWPLAITFKLGVVASLQDADRLEVDCEPLLFDGEKLSLSALIEDEILLALPDYPKHEHDCIEKRSSVDGEYDQHNQSKADNPFSVLAKLKKTGD